MEILRNLKGIVLLILLGVVFGGCLDDSDDPDEYQIHGFSFQMEQKEVNAELKFSPYLVCNSGDKLKSVEVTYNDGSLSPFSMLRLDEYRFESFPFTSTREALVGNYLIEYTPVADYMYPATDPLEIKIENDHILGSFTPELKYQNDRISFSWEPVANATCYGLMVAYEDKDGQYNTINNRFFVKDAGDLSSNTYSIGVREELLTNVNSGVRVKISAVVANDDRHFIYKIGDTKTYVKGDSNFEEDIQQ